MSETLMSWERCGNTPFYRTLDGGGQAYVNPLNWSHISVAVESGSGAAAHAGSASLLYRKAPAYDKKILKGGISTRSSDPEMREKILMSTDAWADSLSKASRDGLSDRDIREMFWEAPEDVKAEVFEGVQALLNGYDDLAMANFNRKSPENKYVTVVAAKDGSVGHMNLEEIKGDHSAARAFVADTLDLAIEEALAFFGIYEC